jgi:hypothetical protein
VLQGVIIIVLLAAGWLILKKADDSNPNVRA